MSNNNFKVKKKKENMITLEEVKESKSSFVIFFRKHSGIIFLSFMIIALTLFIVGLGLTISNFSNISNLKSISSGTSISFYEEKDSLSIVNAIPITEKYALKYFDKKINSLVKNNGVIIEKSSLDIENGKVIYLSDYTSVIIYNDNTYKRIGSISNNYGIDNNGNILSGSTVTNGTIDKIISINEKSKLLYLSNGSIVLINNDYYVLFRDNSNLSFKNDILNNDYNVSIILETDNIGNCNLTYYSDGTIKLIKNNNTYIVRDLSDITITDNDVIINSNNLATVLRNETLLTYKIIYYTDGSAEIVSNDNVIMVRKSSYIVYNDDVYEIITNNDNGINQIYKNNIGDNTVYYFSDGTGVIEFYDGTYRYVDDNTSIKSTLANVNGNDYKGIHNTNDGNLVVTFGDELYFVKKSDGTGYITDNVMYDSNNNILVKDYSASNFSDFISFNITNNSSNKIVYKIVIEETNTDNYKNIYSTNRLNPNYIKYKIVVGEDNESPSFLNNTWSLGYTLAGGLTIKNNTYILYEGQIDGMSGKDVSFMIWLDYDTIINEMMNKAFIGTLKVYSEEIEED